MATINKEFCFQVCVSASPGLRVAGSGLLKTMLPGGKLDPLPAFYSHAVAEFTHWAC